jgi:hypothetical protein
MRVSGTAILRCVLPWVFVVAASTAACSHGGGRRADVPPARPEPDSAAGPTVAAEADARPDAEPPRPKLFDEAELERLRQGILAEARANQTRECRRPLLRGVPRPRRADEDLLELVMGPSPAAACRDAVHGNGGVLIPLTRYLGDVRPAGMPKRRLPFARPADQPLGKWASAFQQVDTACASLPEMIRRAANHEDACNPYLPGRRALPLLLGQLDIARAAGLIARRWMRAGRFEEAGRLLLDAVRVSQDFGRGGGWVSAMIAVVAMETLAAEVELLFNAPAPFPDGLAASLQAELTALLASEPHPSDHFADDCLQLELQDILPALMPAGWMPPGGWDAGREPDPAADAAPASAVPAGYPPATPPADAQALALLAAQDIRDRFLSACPPGCAREGCVDGIETAVAALGRGLDLRREGLELLTAGLRPGADLAAVRSRIRELLVEATVALTMPLYAEFPARTLARPFLLAAFRLHAAFRAVTDETGRCPRLSDFDREPLLSARADAPVGRRLQIDGGEEPGTYRVTTERPLWTPKADDDPTEVRPFLVLRCPGARELPDLPPPEEEPADAEPGDAAPSDAVPAAPEPPERACGTPRDPV